MFIEATTVWSSGLGQNKRRRALNSVITERIGDIQCLSVEIIVANLKKPRL